MTEGMSLGMSERSSRTKHTCAALISSSSLSLSLETISMLSEVRATREGPAEAFRTGEAGGGVEANRVQNKIV